MEKEERGDIHISDTGKMEKNQITRKSWKCWIDLSTQIADFIMTILGIIMNWWCFEKYIFIIFLSIQMPYNTYHCIRIIFFHIKCSWCIATTKYIQDLSSKNQTLCPAGLMRHKTKLQFSCLKDWEFQIFSGNFNFQKTLSVLTADFFFFFLVINF